MTLRCKSNVNPIETITHPPQIRSVRHGSNRVDGDIAILRSWKRIPGGNYGIYTHVSVYYAKTEGVRETMKDTGEPFSIVFRVSGFKDYYDIVVDTSLEYGAG